MEENEQNTPNETGKTREEYSVGKNKPPLGSRFTSEKQPPGSAKSEGKRKKQYTRDCIKEILNTNYEFDGASQVRAHLVKAFGKRALKMTVGELIVMVQAHKAILKGDTQAAMFIHNHGLGMPKQKMEHTGEDGAPISNNVTVTKVIIENPHTKKPGA